MSFLKDIFTGIFLAVLYLEVTQANDMTFVNVGKYATFYVVIFYAAKTVGMDTNIVTNAFVTKTIFSLVDDRIRKKSDTDTEDPKMKTK